MSVFGTDPYANFTGEDVFAGDHKNVPSLIAFDVLQMFGLVGMTLILVTVLVSPTITKRSPVWLNFVVSWIISTASSLCALSLSLVPFSLNSWRERLLLGKSINYIPNHKLCFAQAILIYTVPTMHAPRFLLLARLNLTYSF
jgi:hypothetical protein